MVALFSYCFRGGRKWFPQALSFSFFLFSKKRLEVSLLSVKGRVVHRGLHAPPFPTFHYVFNRHNVRVKCVAYEHDHRPPLIPRPLVSDSIVVTTMVIIAPARCTFFWLDIFLVEPLLFLDLLPEEAQNWALSKVGIQSRPDTFTKICTWRKIHFFLWF